MVRENEQKANYRGFRFFKSTCQACLLLSRLLASAPLVSILHVRINGPAVLSANLFSFYQTL